MKKILVLAIAIFLLIVNQANADTNVSACGTLSSAGTYVLNQSISSANTCITIGSDNITLDGAGYTINYSQTPTVFASSGFGIYSDGYNNLTLKNLIIVEGNRSGGGYNFGMSLRQMINSKIITTA